MADIVLLFVLKGRDCMSKVLIEVLVIILIAGSYLILYSAVRVSAIADQRIAEIRELIQTLIMFGISRIIELVITQRKSKCFPVYQTYRKGTVI